MPLKSAVYNRLPEFLKPLARQGYHRVTDRATDEALHAEFVDDFFRSREEYERYVDEFERGPATELRNEALERYQRVNHPTPPHPTRSRLRRSLR